MASQAQRKMVKAALRAMAPSLGVPVSVVNMIPDLLIDQIINHAGTNATDIQDFIQNLFNGNTQQTQQAADQERQRQDMLSNLINRYSKTARILDTIGTVGKGASNIIGAVTAYKPAATANMLENIMQEKHITPTAEQKAATRIAPFLKGKAALNQYLGETVGNTIKNALNVWSGGLRQDAVQAFADKTGNVNSAYYWYQNKLTPKP